MLPNEKCGECKFFIEKMEKLGECRRYAPRPNAQSINWSKVSLDHWCGEFEQKKPPEGQPINPESTD